MTAQIKAAFEFYYTRYFRVVFAIALSISVVACVSVTIGPKKPSMAKNVIFEIPPSPYVAFDSDDIDSGWKNGLKGSSITFKSTCGDALDLPLESIHQSLLSGIDAARVLGQKRLPFNEREALNSVVEGKVDGVDTKMELMILKKNHCTYVITFVSVIRSFDSEKSIFHNFLKRFEAP